MCSVQCAMCCVQCSVCSVQRAVCSVQCSVFSVQCSVFSVQCSVCSVQCAMCSVQCAVCSVQCAVTVPSNYVIVADMTRVSLVGLELGNDRSVYTVVYGQFFNSFTAVALDSLRYLIYYTDVTRLLNSLRCYHLPIIAMNNKLI